MHVSLKHARRVVLGVAVGALFLAAAPGSGQAEILTLCISPSAQKVVLPLGGTCNKPNRLITWDSYGVVGPSGPLGSQGSARTAGTDRHCRSAGTARTCGTGRRDRDAWILWRYWSDRQRPGKWVSRDRRDRRDRRERPGRRDRRAPRVLTASTEPNSTRWAAATSAATSRCCSVTRAYWVARPARAAETHSALRHLQQ